LIFYDTISENLSSNPLHEAFSGFQVVTCESKSCSKMRAMILKIVSKAGYDMIHWKKIRQWQRRKARKEFLMRLSEQSFFK
jgi:hypothetical protein